jgi:hypothetical protein
MEHCEACGNVILKKDYSFRELLTKEEKERLKKLESDTNYCKECQTNILLLSIFA